MFFIMVKIQQLDADNDCIFHKLAKNLVTLLNFMIYQFINMMHTLCPIY